jgi:hypothetical protein
MDSYQINSYLWGELKGEQGGVVWKKECRVCTVVNQIFTQQNSVDDAGRPAYRAAVVLSLFLSSVPVALCVYDKRVWPVRNGALDFRLANRDMVS